MLGRQEQIPNYRCNDHHTQKETQLLPFMVQMLDSVSLKMKSCNKQKEQMLIAQSIYLINKTLVNMYKLNKIEIRALIRLFLHELSIRRLETTSSRLLPFMKELLDSVILKLTPNNRRMNQQLISESIYLINKTLANKLSRYEIQSLIDDFLLELSINKKNASCNQPVQSNQPVLHCNQPVQSNTNLLPFMQVMLDRVLLKMSPTDKNKNQQLISECIYLTNKALVHKFNRSEIQSLLRSFLQELSTRFLKQNPGYGKHEPRYTEKPKPQNYCRPNINHPRPNINHCRPNIEEKPECNDPPVSTTTTRFLDNLSITIPNDLCRFLL